ncbi:uncharacterized protein PAN0_017d5462 [Moesziomyces antarcticus]|uniref:Uncharacterized protein n=2 Tax=Pseudozyma antarctica TaxID=84753 RepID=A0A081CKN9_PSEA2|nr:uncharacterized protein PAN0_017d5462 [Moesziomyces antarcticus]GAK67235.1 hypothetical protein PAN0_017d5462 [Moesziomyces antarcticus]SPO48157.1 uncharacterized protein PSANT_05845 [Moesziomyces antarcticus]
MSSGPASQDSSLSAATFLASISAESTVAFEPGTSSSAPGSAPALPISAKVSLIDAQIDALEGQAEREVTAHAAELRARAASTRAVDHDLDRLWLSINQTSSRLVTVGPQVAPKAIEYHDALAQSSKQALLLSVLSDLLASTRLLERLEKLQTQSDLAALRSELPMVAQVMEPFRSRPALKTMPAIVELEKRFERLQTLSTETTAASTRASNATPQSPQPAPSDSAVATQGAANAKEALQSEQALSPALKVLEAARALIVAGGPDAGWKEVQIELDAPALPPGAQTTATPPAQPAVQPAAGSQRSSSDVHRGLLSREDLTQEGTSLTRNSSSSSSAAAAGARSRHKPKLGARLIRPQDQLGSGPFNAEDAALEEDGWGLDDDDHEELESAPALDESIHSAGQPTSNQSVNQYPHQSVAALARDDWHSSPSSSVRMRASMSSSSSQRSAFAIQELETPAAASGAEVDAWGLGEDEVADGHDHHDEAEAWDLDDDDDVVDADMKHPQAAAVAVADPPKVPATVVDSSPQAAVLQSAAPTHQSEAPKPSDMIPGTPLKDHNGHSDVAPPYTPATDAWGLEDDMDVEDGENPPAPSAALIDASLKDVEVDSMATTNPAKSSGTPHRGNAVAKSSDEDTSNQDVAPREPSKADTPPVTTAPDAWGLEDDDDAEDDPWEAEEQPQLVSNDRRESPLQAPVQLNSGTSDSLALPPPRPSTSSAASGPTKLQHSAAQASTKAGDTAEQEPEPDAWGFEEGSSASEADQVERITAISPVKEAPSKLAAVGSLGVDLPSEIKQTTPLSTEEDPGRVAPVKDSFAAPSETPEEPARPPSPSPWGEDFSDAESTGLPEPQASDTPSPAIAVRSAGPSIERSGSGRRELDAQPVDELKSAALGQQTAQKEPIKKEACVISKRSQDLVNLAESTMATVIGLLRGSDSNGGNVDDAEALAGTIYKIFELHRALMPVAHGEVLRDVPALAMQFFNDSEYLARELARLVEEKGQAISAAWAQRDAEGAKRWSTKEMVKLEQEAALTRALGQRWFEAQMTTQTKILLDTIVEADGFARTFDEHRFARCERCIKQVVQTLQQLAKAWRGVLVASRYHAAMGRLVDLVFQKVLHDVLDLEDIGESESEKIASLVKTLGSLESVFAAEGEQQSSAPLWVPSWFKTSYLIEILTGSLVDIEFLAFEAGALVDYSRKELAGLVKALFADTPKRSRLLQKIETASVDVLAH